MSGGFGAESCECVTEARCACEIGPHPLLMISAATALAAVVWMVRTYFSTPNNLKSKSDCSLSTYQTSTAQNCASEFGAVSRVARNCKVVHTELLPLACSINSVARIALLLTCRHAVGPNTCIVSAAILFELYAHPGQVLRKVSHPFGVSVHVVVVVNCCNRVSLLSALWPSLDWNRLVVFVVSAALL